MMRFAKRCFNRGQIKEHLIAAGFTENPNWHFIRQSATENKLAFDITSQQQNMTDFRFFGSKLPTRVYIDKGAIVDSFRTTPEFDATEWPTLTP